MKRGLEAIVVGMVCVAGLFIGTTHVSAQKNTEDEIETIKVTNKAKAKLYVDEVYRIKAKSKKWKNKKIVWKSSKPKVAAVTDGNIVEIRKKGTAKLTAWYKYKKRKLSFTIKARKVIELKKMNIECAQTFTVGQTVKINKKIVPSNVTNLDCQFSSTNPSVASITKEGMLTAHKEGTATIILRDLESCRKVKKKIYVSEVAVSGVKFSDNNVKKMQYGEKIQLNAVVLPENATDKRIKWKSMNTNIATVDENGVVTAKRPSENVDIVAESKDDSRKYAVWHIAIYADKGYITKETLDSKKLDDVNKVMFVSHPDDELFWGGGHLIQDSYLVVCVTNDYPTEERKKEFEKMMNETGEKCIVLDYPDSRINRGYLKNDVDCLTTSDTGLKKDIMTVLKYKKWDEVVTHNPDGEYGKYNHQRVSGYVTNAYKELNGKLQGLYYFGKFYWGTVPGKPMDDAIVKRKIELISWYIPTAKGAVEAFKHMLPYENWVAAESWK